MNKQEFIRTVAEKAGLSKQDTKVAVEAVLETITETLSNKQSVAFVGFGKFSTAYRATELQELQKFQEQIELLMFQLLLPLSLRLESYLNQL